MDEFLLTGHWDAELTTLAIEQTNSSLSDLEDIQLIDLQCGNRFCAAHFEQDGHESSTVAALFGQPPFMSEGFTVDGADGRVSIYFTQPGVTISALRSEALSRFN